MRVYLIGLGVLGLTFGQYLRELKKPHEFFVIANEERQLKLSPDQVTIGGVPQRFDFLTPAELAAADLILIACKSFALETVLKDIHKAVRPGTIIMSLLNGISSEGQISALYPEARVIHAVAQGMDGVRREHHLNYILSGQICFGLVPGQGPEIANAIEDVAALFALVNLPHSVMPDMAHHQWGKFMLNCGLNQAAAYYKGTYGTCQSNPEARSMMITAFREVIAVAEAEGINLGETDIDYWLGVLDTLNPEGMPSMRQDQRDGRQMETELFSGTVLKLGAKHGLATPVNRAFYERLSNC